MADDKNWKATLSPDEYRVTRQAGTERPYTGVLLDEKRPGTYICKCCGAPLFSSDAKFDSGCGWPSFDQQTNDGNVLYREDNSHGMRRTEIICKSCDAHLGHVFPDGPTETGQRYCVNSLSLNLKTAEDEVVRG
ncbi:peptide-methionine (R)-S-oxide reductase MsrB [Alteromonas sp. RKMC-009]|uniref:peptide-methionine (R)-S-oxide reductase MsrB n=1 Tax=Alteromonas sp. RKMC-009 TaxID=2267264 RepID=UPI000E69B69C|nr:peptide-methionine (R)-S-oxide reductase MsrB [Alteromonas sp. RKMC-009]AYA64229.1 peptide-methionine (R)-S-oxide reductase [Alteromonas sp. RKMC-009]